MSTQWKQRRQEEISLCEMWLCTGTSHHLLAAGDYRVFQIPFRDPSLTLSSHSLTPPTVAAQVKDFSELLCHGEMKGKAAGKAQHQQSGFCAFTSEAKRGFSWVGRQEISSDRDAGRMEMGWFEEQLFAPAHPESALGAPTAPNTQTFIAASQGGEVMCQGKTNRNWIVMLLCFCLEKDAFLE